jgi:hypothetical protein
MLVNVHCVSDTLCDMRVLLLVRLDGYMLCVLSEFVCYKFLRISQTLNKFILNRLDACT